jgi:hypothetical protein
MPTYTNTDNTLCCLRFERKGRACRDCPIAKARPRSMLPGRYRFATLFSRLGFHIRVTDVSHFRQGLDFFRRIFK